MVRDGLIGVQFAGRDHSRTRTADLNTANIILAPSISQLQLLTGTHASFDFWKFINWIFVINHWLLLFDFGQLVPTYSDISLDFDTSSQLKTFTSANNIFINNTLFSVF